jgi:hypothetical protein
MFDQNRLLEQAELLGVDVSFCYDEKVLVCMIKPTPMLTESIDLTIRKMSNYIITEISEISLIICEKKDKNIEVLYNYYRISDFSDKQT